MAVREPRYYDVKRHLAGLARSLPPGSPLPPERSLAADFATSRTTVRQAVAELVVEGRLTRQHGSGTYVAPPKVTQSLDLTSYTQQMRERGVEPGARLLSLGLVAADPDVARRLGLRRGRRVVQLVRLRLADGEPMALETTFLESARFPGLVAGLSAAGEGASLYEVLDRDYGVRPGEAEATVEAALAAPDEAELLDVDTGLPVLLLTQLTLDGDGRPLEWVRSVYRGDRCTLVVHPRLKRRSR